MRQCGQIWLKLKAASKLISFQLIWFELKESEGERERETEGGGGERERMREKKLPALNKQDFQLRALS